MYPTMYSTTPWSLVKGGFHKTPRFNTQTQKPAAGRGRSSISLMPYAEWDFQVDLNMVPGGEAVAYSVLQQFLAVYMLCCGGGSFFYFTDPNDNAVQNPTNGDPAVGILLNVTDGAALPFGQVGDGTSTHFQLARHIGAAVDILQNVTDYSILVNGAAVSQTVSASGVVVFATAPPADAVLAWEGSFRYLCQFKEDTLKDLARVSKNANGFLWSCSSIEFEGVFV